MDRIELENTMTQVYTALVERGYRPTDQIIGYILTGDPTYITNHNGARRIISAIDPHDLLCDIVINYFSAE